jgi:hypothetical protein
VVDVPGGQVSQRPTPPTLELDQRRAPGPGRRRLISTPERLELGLLIGADDEVAGVQEPAVAPARVKIEHDRGLSGKRRVAREDPRALLPRLQGGVVQSGADRRR